MRFCPHCGETYENEDAVCPSCGKEVPQPVYTPSFVENDSAFNTQTVKEFYKSFFRCAAIILFCGCALLLCGVLKLTLCPDLVIESPVSFSLGGVCIFIGVAFLLLHKYILTKNPMITNKTRQFYRFEEEEVSVQTYDGPERRGVHRVRYEQISKVSCTKTHLLFYFGNLVWMVDRNGYVYGTEKQLKEHLIAKNVKGANFINAQK